MLAYITGAGLGLMAWATAAARSDAPAASLHRNQSESDATGTTASTTASNNTNTINTTNNKHGSNDNSNTSTVARPDDGSNMRQHIRNGTSGACKGFSAVVFWRCYSVMVCTGVLSVANGWPITQFGMSTEEPVANQVFSQLASTTVSMLTRYATL
jgi:hypothetical protein